MAAGADSIDDLDVLRAGGMPHLFDGVYAAATLGQFLREFTFGHARQLESVLRAHLVALAERTGLLAGIDEQAFIDIDSLLRPVYGHAKQGASYGHTKIAGKQVLRKGLSPLATTISTAHGAPVIAGMRLRAGKAGSARARRDGRPGDRHRPRGRRDREDPGPRRLGLRQPRRGRRLPARPGPVLPGADQEPGRDRGRSPPSRTTRGPRCDYPGAVRDPDTGQLISDAEVAEITYTAFAATKHPITARLVVRRVSDAPSPTSCSRSGATTRSSPTPTEPTAQADITHRRHAIIETVFADLIDGPLAHLPSGRFGANSAWAICAAIAHNLLRAAGTLAGDRTPSPAARPCADASSPSPPDWPARTPTRPAPTRALALGRSTGYASGPPSAQPTRQPPDPSTADTARPTLRGKAGQTSRPARPTPQQDQ